MVDFTVTNMTKDHIFPYKIDEYVKHKYILEDCWKDVSPELFREYEKELGWHTLVIAKPSRADRLPRKPTIGIFSEIDNGSEDDAIDATSYRLNGPMQDTPIRRKKKSRDELRDLGRMDLANELKEEEDIQDGLAILKGATRKVDRSQGLFDILANEEKEMEQEKAAANSNNNRNVVVKLSDIDGRSKNSNNKEKEEKEKEEKEMKKEESQVKQPQEAREANKKVEEKIETKPIENKKEETKTKEATQQVKTPENQPQQQASQRLEGKRFLKRFFVSL